MNVTTDDLTAKCAAMQEALEKIKTAASARSYELQASCGNLAGLLAEIHDVADKAGKDSAASQLIAQRDGLLSALKLVVSQANGDLSDHELRAYIRQEAAKVIGGAQ